MSIKMLLCVIVMLFVLLLILGEAIRRAVWAVRGVIFCMYRTLAEIEKRPKKPEPEREKPPDRVRKSPMVSIAAERLEQRRGDGA